MVTKRTVLTFAAAFYTSACVRPSPVTVASVPAMAGSPTSAAEPQDASAAIIQQGTAVSLPVAAITETAAAPMSAILDSVHVSPSDVTRRAAEVFGDSLLAAPAEHVDSAASAPSWDIEVRPYESTERVEHYVRMFSGPSKERIQRRLERGTRYEPMIRAKLKAGGLPEDMYYLALIESGFDPNAYSRAAAVGMWQFMTSTARDMGLRVDWWIDERRDPMKSTAAAVRFIKGLKEQFGSLYLAAAAYNGGPGRIARGLSRYADDFEGTTGDDLFFALAHKDYLRNETREYVPQLIAAALVAKEPERYGMKLTPLPPINYDSVRVGPATPLAAVARAAASSVEQVKDLNPQILRGVTPPRDSYWVRLPVGAADSFPAAFAALPKSERVGLRRAESKKGETILSIARESGISERQLSLYNPNLRRLRSGKLAAGQSVLIPSEAVAAAAIAVPDPAIERYSRSHVTAMHVVTSRETLSGIARKYHTTVAVLMRENGLRKALIFPGQSLAVAKFSRTSSRRAASRMRAKLPKNAKNAKNAKNTKNTKNTKNARAAKDARDVKKSAAGRKGVVVQRRHDHRLARAVGSQAGK